MNMFDPFAWLEQILPAQWLHRLIRPLSYRHPAPEAIKPKIQLSTWNNNWG